MKKIFILIGVFLLNISIILIYSCKKEKPTLPGISTNTVTGLSSATANSGGNVTSDGGATVTARGVCWNTSANPTITNSKTSDGTGTGVFSSLIAGLTLGTTLLHESLCHQQRRNKLWK